MFFSFNRDSVYKKRRKTKIALVLSGGAGRGVGHIGAIKALSELGIDFDIVVGTSAGSVIGALYALGMTPDEMTEKLQNIKPSDITGTRFWFGSASTSALEETLNSVMGGNMVFSDLKKPFVAVSTNIKTGREVRISSGSVAKAVAGSCAFPIYFKPCVWEDKVLVDGGLVNSIPIDVAKELDADYVVAVDVNSTRGGGINDLKIGNIISSSLGIMLKKNADSFLNLADIVIRPNLKDFKATKLEDTDEMIKEGYTAVMSRKDEIISVLNKRSRIKVNICKREDVEYV